MLNIKESYNGYWISEEYHYLDTYNNEVNKSFDFNYFTKEFNFYAYENREWLGSNPFTVSTCDRYWLENEKSFVEIHISNWKDKTNITVHKVITDKYENSKELMKDLLDLDELYRNIIDSIENDFLERLFEGDTNE